MNKIKVVFAEDEPNLGQIVKDSLESRDFTIFHALDGELAHQLYKEHQPDILVLDVMMPKKDGFTLAEEIRKENKTIPIIFLTAKSQTKNVIEGFNYGGNDYIKKPFSIEELIVRINSLVKRNEQSKNEYFQLGRYYFNHTKQNLMCKNEEIFLTHKESELLFCLVQEKNQVIDKNYILNRVWGKDDFFKARSMDVYITKLRRKLQKDDTIQILNIKGIGYKLVC